MMILSDGTRIVRLFWGLFLYSVGIVLTIHANIGLAPWDVFHQGVAMHLGITMGLASIVTAITIVSVAALLKEHVGFGTLCNMIAIGAFLDLLRMTGWIPEMQDTASGIAMLAAGLFVIAFASYFYMGAGYGAGPRDSLMVVLAKRTGYPVGACRCCIEGTVLLLGWLLGGHVGIGTVLSAVGSGFAVQVVFTLLRFNVREIPQESFRETYLRYRNRSAFRQGEDAAPCCDLQDESADA